MSRCPVGTHKGEYWRKLDGITDAHRFRLAKLEHKWSHELTEEQIRADTFPDMTRAGFEDCMRFWYGTGDVFGFFLTFATVSALDEGRTFTTFRAYEPRTDVYYRGCARSWEAFRVVLNGKNDGTTDGNADDTDATYEHGSR